MQSQVMELCSKKIAQFEIELLCLCPIASYMGAWKVILIYLGMYAAHCTIA